MVVVNPNCKACAKVHRHIREISADISISLVIYTNDRLSVHIAQTILSAYLSEGWDRAIYLLEVWFEIQEIPDVEKYEEANRSFPERIIQLFSNKHSLFAVYKQHFCLKEVKTLAQIRT